MLRLTWVQPEDLIGHELRQATQDGREPGRIAARWRAAGGPEAPSCAGASTGPVSRYLRLLAEDLLDELADLPSRLTEDEPTDLPHVRALCPDWPAQPTANWPAQPTQPTQPTQPAGSRAAEAAQTDPPDTRQAPNWPQPAGSRAAGAAPVGAGCARQAPASEPPPTPTALRLRLEAAWLGRAAGCLLGKPVEKLPLTAIRQLARSTGNWPLNTWFTARGVPEELTTAHPWNRRSAATSLAENIDGMPEDDDLNYPLLNLLLLQRHGPRFTTTDVAKLWLDELPAGRTFTAERIAYRNLLSGLEPPLTARHRNPFREWIGALIRADVHGWTNPGDPATAAEQAYRDATLTHTANGVYAAMFTAATIARAATGTHDIHTCLRTGLTVIPARSRLAEAVRHGIQLARSHRDFTVVVDELHATHASTYHWVHAIPNTALIAAALTHADGDFTGSICRAVSGGWDTDSNGATAGSVAGLLAGSPGALPDRWTGPLKNRLATSVADFNGTGFDTLAQLTSSLIHMESAHR
ncbi:crystallin [Streptomyces sp. NRRL WC-3618]|uniref:ADP-ribosylglycohydrolase family protein n=1 Tax=Streptomyces sp. NRRL WC-3618 TaxID=1519490 RepID=UPI0006AFD414|nr:ADP-ribosylglycohydrolase family protein [Streptomyces sp. NRRL WC-3618]KOV74331.1 crystallin [Streptomyces sp. NRRL WC-3618]